MRPDFSGRVHIFEQPSNVRFGSLADPFLNIRLMAALERVAALQIVENQDSEGPDSARSGRIGKRTDATASIQHCSIYQHEYGKAVG